MRHLTFQNGQTLSFMTVYGSDLCYWLLLESGNVIARTTVQYVVRVDFINEDIKRQIDQFDMNVNERLNEREFSTEDSQTSSIFYRISFTGFLIYGDRLNPYGTVSYHATWVLTCISVTRYDTCYVKFIILSIVSRDDCQLLYTSTAFMMLR